MSRRCRSNTTTGLCVLFASLLTLHATRVAGAEPFELVLRTQTSHLNNAGTNEGVYFALYYEEIVEVEGKPGTKPKRVRQLKRLEHSVDNRGNDRKTGAIETYHLTFDCPPSAIRAVEIGMVSGDDAWHLTGFQYYLVVDGRKSRATTVPVGRWISAAVNDGGKKNRAMQFYRFAVAPPSFPVPR